MEKSWSSAKRNGDKHYYTGKPCKHGHTGLRFTKSGACVDCNYIKSMRRNSNLDNLNDEQVLSLRKVFRPKEPKPIQATNTNFTALLNKALC